jgi:hypothetical protein
MDLENNMRGSILPPAPMKNTPKQNAVELTDCVPPPPPDEDLIRQLDHSYQSWYTLGLNAFSALSIGTTVFSVLTVNGFISLLSCNSVFSILSVNSAFSVLSTNSAFAIGCVDKRFAICFNH